MTDVHAVVGILRRPDGALFMQQRHAPQSFDGHWEFPGGKVDEGELPADALRREFQEEIGIEVCTAHHWLRRRVTRPVGGELILDFFDIDSYHGEPTGSEGQLWQWAFVNDLPSPLLPANTLVCKWLQLPPVCVVTAADIFGAEEMLRRLELGLRERGWKLVQLRDKSLPPDERSALAAAALSLCRAHGALLLINDDEKLASQADGLHLSSQRLLSYDVRPDIEWVGASCHTAEELLHASSLGLDYAVLSPVCRTLSHVAVAPMGWDKFSELAIEAGMPVYALGGMTEKDLLCARKHGAKGIAMMRKAWE